MEVCRQANAKAVDKDQEAYELVNIGFFKKMRNRDLTVGQGVLPDPMDSEDGCFLSAHNLSTIDFLFVRTVET
jgi:hypothetical protein